jgi:anti-sigma regulatory factor (Ser/Thr protein kinase)
LHPKSIVGEAVLDPSETLSIRAAADDIRFASEWLVQACSRREMPTDQLARLDLCLNEALANVIAHGGAAAQSEPLILVLRFTPQTAPVSNSVEAKLTVSDAGQAFNPLTAESKPRPQTLAEANLGGLGVTMMQTFSDTIDYDYLDGRNHLSFGVRWSGSR